MIEAEEERRKCGENVGKLYFREGWNGAEKLLFDPGTYKAGVVTTIESIVPSWDGKYVLTGLFLGRRGVFRDPRVGRGTATRCCRRACIRPWDPPGGRPDSKSFFYDMGKVTDIKSR